MKFAPRPLISAAVLALGAAGAFAQSPATTAPGPGAQGPAMMRDQAQQQGRWHERMQERMQRRMERFKRILQITPQQDSAFNAWAAAMRPPAQQQRPNREELARLPTPERIDRMKQLRAARLAEMDKRGDATKVFYAQLTPAQQKAFDEISLRFMRGGRAGHGHGGHGGYGQKG